MKNPILPIRRRHGGFTLVELLVTIAIVIVLAALAFLGLRRAKKSAELAVTVNRIRSLAHANSLYATDHNGKYVPIYSFDEESRASVQWHYNQTFLEPLIGIQSCLEEYEVHEGADGLPEEVLDPIVVREKKRFWSRISASFGYNQENMPGGGWGQPGTDRSHSVISMTTPTQTFQFITCTDWIAKYSGRYIWRQKPEEGKTEDGKIAYRHGERAVVVYYDGHADTITVDEMRTIDRRGGIDNVFWGGDRR
jgi:prepilin-type N-terminal cleavage/methylation domain-containing protein/prepilin-type processing-associated H-X9-DG protein